ncbi:hypothetical protein BKA69DRAFT_153940 [Paraphysoderma sedebokerense]|nr:hypothetical protein BKA69DRAFT_153940 [Paraphysoderma sedebokerense]
MRLITVPCGIRPIVSSAPPPGLQSIPKSNHGREAMAPYRYDGNDINWETSKKESKSFRHQPDVFHENQYCTPEVQRRNVAGPPPPSVGMRSNGSCESLAVADTGESAQTVKTNEIEQVVAMKTLKNRDSKYSISTEIVEQKAAAHKLKSEGAQYSTNDSNISSGHSFANTQPTTIKLGQHDGESPAKIVKVIASSPTQISTTVIEDGAQDKHNVILRNTPEHTGSNEAGPQISLEARFDVETSICEFFDLMDTKKEETLVVSSVDRAMSTTANHNDALKALRPGYKQDDFIACESSKAHSCEHPNLELMIIMIVVCANMILLLAATSNKSKETNNHTRDKLILTPTRESLHSVSSSAKTEDMKNGDFTNALSSTALAEHSKCATEVKWKTFVRNLKWKFSAMFKKKTKEHKKNKPKRESSVVISYRFENSEDAASGSQIPPFHEEIVSGNSRSTRNMLLSWFKKV